MNVYNDIADRLINARDSLDIIQLRIVMLQEERDALEADLRLLGHMGINVCPVCANYNNGQGCKECVKCLKEDNFKWRGVVKKEETT